jgi:hypothetical protein
MKHFKTKHIHIQIRRFLLPQPAPPPAEEDAFKPRSYAGFVCIERGENNPLFCTKLLI